VRDGAQHGDGLSQSTQNILDVSPTIAGLLAYKSAPKMLLYWQDDAQYANVAYQIGGCIPQHQRDGSRSGRLVWKYRNSKHGRAAALPSRSAHTAALLLA
jgi:hypothetical protein